MIKEPTMPDDKLFYVPSFALQKGGMLPVASLGYKTVGTLNAARDNVVLAPSWYTGTHDDTATLLVGTDHAIDPEKYFVVLPDLLCNGISSSPSNTSPPFDRARFPNVTFWDNVRLQHILLTEHLGINRIKLIASTSMGAAQCFQWAATYPEMVGAICPIVGAARTASYNKMFLLSLERALKLDPAFNDGFYDRPLVRGIEAFATIYAGWGVSEPFFRTRAYEEFGAKDYDQFTEYFWKPFFLKCDANDLLSQLWTWLHGDISDNTIYGGAFEKALSSIRARTIIVPCDTDRYFPPVDSEYEARHIPGAECRSIPSIWGHIAPFNPPRHGVHRPGHAGTFGGVRLLREVLRGNGRRCLRVLVNAPSFL
jgi:homoserine O-acetyltransferase/O-succinyltransferase